MTIEDFRTMKFAITYEIDGEQPFWSQDNQLIFDTLEDAKHYAETVLDESPYENVQILDIAVYKPLKSK